MSSGNEHYKSRLLNFLNRQTIHFQDKVGIALRNLRSTTEMGTQILLYPFYLMVQTGRATRQQLESKVQSSLLLSEAQTSPSDSENSNSELENISNPQEQKALSQYIVSEEKKLNLIVATTQKILASLPQISQRNDVNSEPVKVFWRMLDWLQTSTVAKKIDLFGESKLVSSAPKLPSRTTKIPLPNLFVALDDKVADLETKSWLSTLGNNLVWRSPSANIQTNSTQSQPELSTNPFQIRAIINAALEHFFGTNSSGVNKQIKGKDKFNLPHSDQNISLESKTASTYLPPADTQKSWLSWSNIFRNTITSAVKPRSSSANIQTNSTQSQPELTSNPFQIRAIIQAALEHFFGTNSSGVNKQIKGKDKFNLPNAAQSIPLESKTASTYLPDKSPDLNLPPAEERESWLSWHDIFSNTITSTVKPRSSEPKKDRTQIQGSPSLSSLPLDKAGDHSSINYFGNPNTQLETDPNLLETQATTVGYEKHLLEQILEILDQIFVWIEEKLLKIWRVLKFKKL